MIKAQRRSRRSSPGVVPALLLAVLLSLASPAQAQFFVPPHADWQTLETEHFRVNFTPGLEALARHAAIRAEVAYARFSQELAAPPRGRIDIVLADNVDYVAGAAAPFPSNRILLNARAPVDHLSLGYQTDWIDLVVVHELAHIFHFNRTSAFGRGLRRVFGHAPFAWPIHPVLGTPLWSIEGLATVLESYHTGAGRVYGTHHAMILRTAVLAGEFESIAQAEGHNPHWPRRGRPYIYGSLFMDFIARRYGTDALRQIIDATASSVIPPALAFERVARRATGRSFSQLWADWQQELESTYGAMADSLEAQGLTRPERLTQQGHYAMHPRVSPDGGRVVLVRDDGRSDPVTVLLDPETGNQRVLARRSQFGGAYGPASWHPDGSMLVTAQFEFDGPYEITSDLYRIGAFGDEWRLTYGARMSSPDVAPEGRRVVAVQASGGTNRLVVLDLATYARRPVTEYQPGLHWALPRWSPDGRRIAVGRWNRGVHDIIILDENGTILREFPSGHAISAAPAWSPDGRYLFFWSDRSGIPNIYAVDLRPEGAADAEPVLYQVTNLLTGAFYPDVSPDARWIYFTGYGANGYAVERIAFDIAHWRPPAPTRPRALAQAVAPGVVLPEPGMIAVSQPRTYEPGASLLPRYWLPLLVEGDTLVGQAFLGAMSSGADVVGQHRYFVWAAIGPENRFQGAIDYTYAGIGNPLLRLHAGREWEGEITADGTGRLLREDGAGLIATYVFRAWRYSLSVSGGFEWIGRFRERAPSSPQPPITKPQTDLIGASAGFAFGNARQHPFSISLEDGLGLNLVARQFLDFSPPTPAGTTQRLDGYSEMAGVGRAYKSLEGAAPGASFARAIAAARIAGGWRYGRGARPFSVGGGPGALQSWADLPSGRAGPFLPVRGFERGATLGTRAWASSLEYRMPLALLASGRGLWPLFLDRLSASVFVDAASAWCSGSERSFRLRHCPAFEPLGLLGSGGELNLDLVLWRTPFRFRAGVGYPVHGPGEKPVLHLGVGPTF